MVNLQANSVHKRATLLSLDNIDYYLVSREDLTKKVTKKKAKKRQSTDNQVTTNNNDNKNNNDSNNKYNYDDFHLEVAKSLAAHNCKKIETFT
jgi:hypothetical protein